MGPYRASNEPTLTPARPDATWLAACLVGVLCATRLVGGLLRGDDLGGEVTLAMLGLIATTPSLFRRGARSAPC